MALTIRVVVDTETTGLGVNTPGGERPDGVCEIGLAWRESGMLTSMKFECDPGEEFYKDGRADQALKVNGYTVAKLKTLPPSTTVADNVIAALTGIAKRTGAKVRLAAYNSPFDSWFLAQPPWMLEPDCGYDWEPDLMERAAKAAGVPAGENGHRFTLKAAMAFAQIERFGKAHDAESDAIDALKLAEWLDSRDTQQTLTNTAGPTEVVKSLEAYLTTAPKSAVFPRPQAERTTTVSPSDLWMRPREYWRRYHGGGREEDAFFEEIKRPFSMTAEKIVLDRFEAAGLWTLRGEYVCNDGFAGKLDGRIEWPKGTGQWILVEVKSKWDDKTLQACLAYPQPAWLDQMECYLRLTGVRAALLAVFKMGIPDKPETWEFGYRLFTPDDTRWAKIVEKGNLLRPLQAADAKEPQ